MSVALALYLNESAASEAYKLNLHYVGWGKWANKQDIVVAKTVNGKLIMLAPDFHHHIDQMKKIYDMHNDTFTNHNLPPNTPQSTFVKNAKAALFDEPEEDEKTISGIPYNVDPTTLTIKPKKSEPEKSKPDDNVESNNLKIVMTLVHQLNADKDAAKALKAKQDQLPKSEPKKSTSTPSTEKPAPKPVAVKKKKFVSPFGTEPKTSGTSLYVHHHGKYDLDQFKKIGEAKGSNAGGFYEKEGVPYYIKQYNTNQQCMGELLANGLYRKFGISAPDTTGVMAPNQGYGFKRIATKIISGQVATAKTITNPEIAKQIMKGFVADVLLQNWDVIGLNNDNIIIDSENNVHRIDNGSAFMYRAQGEKKPWESKHDIGELKTFLDPSINPRYAAVAKAAGVLDMPKEEWEAELKLQTDNIVKTVKEAGGVKALLKSIYPSYYQNDNEFVNHLTTRLGLLYKATRTESTPTVQKPMNIDTTLPEELQNVQDMMVNGNDLNLYLEKTFSPVLSSKIDYLRMALENTKIKKVLITNSTEAYKEGFVTPFGLTDEDTKERDAVTDLEVQFDLHRSGLTKAINSYDAGKMYVDKNYEKIENAISKWQYGDIQFTGKVRKQINRTVNAFILQNVDVCSYTMPFPLYRGVALGTTHAKKFIKYFEEGKEVGIPPCGFSTRKKIAYKFSKCDTHNAAKKLQVIFKIVPNENQPLVGINFNSRNHKPYEFEHEFAVAGMNRFKVKSSKMVVIKKPGKLSGYDYELQDIGMQFVVELEPIGTTTDPKLIQEKDKKSTTKIPISVILRHYLGPLSVIRPKKEKTNGKV